MMKDKGWYIIKMHGSLYQAGFPDLFCTHANFGPRLVEIKNPESYHFTAAQEVVFPELSKNGTGIWILVDDTKAEYEKLFRKPNWTHYLRVMKHNARF